MFRYRVWLLGMRGVLGRNRMTPLRLRLTRDIVSKGGGRGILRWTRRILRWTRRSPLRWSRRTPLGWSAVRG